MIDIRIHMYTLRRWNIHMHAYIYTYIQDVCQYIIQNLKYINDDIYSKRVKIKMTQWKLEENFKKASVGFLHDQ